MTALHHPKDGAGRFTGSFRGGFIVPASEISRFSTQQVSSLLFRRLPLYI